MVQNLERLYIVTLCNSMQSTSCKMPDWMKHKLASRLPGEISTTSDIYDTTLMAECEEQHKSLLMRVKEESDKAGLKINIEKMKILAFGPISSWQIDGETMETVIEFIFLSSKITEAMKLKDTCTLEEKL